MAHIESQALGGYYKTPPHLIPGIANLLDVRLLGPAHDSPRCIFVDPCAGTGEAVVNLATEMIGPVDARRGGLRFFIHTAELEKDRADECSRMLTRVSRSLPDCLEGDAFKVSWGGQGQAHILYLNPPYDWDAEYKRLEHRFLVRFADVLHPGIGALVFVVPQQALSASAEFIATHFNRVHCYRFPDPDFDNFKQVVLVAQRRTIAAATPQASIVDMINSWGRDASTLPVLGSSLAPIIHLDVESGHPRKLPVWQLEPIDLEAILRGYHPFKYGKAGSLSPMHGYGFDTSMSDYFQKRFPAVLPPRPVHVATALASGIMNGERIEPDDPDSDLPSLLVKGTFLKEYQTVDETVDKKGNLTSVTRVQRPQLQVTALNLDTWQYIDLQKGSDPTGTKNVRAFNIADLLANYGRSLVALMMNQCPPLHDPSDPNQAIDLPIVAGKTPYVAQVACLSGILKMLFSGDPAFKGQNPFVLGEVGTGKTIMSLIICEALSRRNFGHMAAQMKRLGIHGGSISPISRVLIMCPSHIVPNWKEAVEEMLPAAALFILERMGDVERAAAFTPTIGDDRPGAGLVIMLVNKELAKLGHAWEPALMKGRGCPVCGAIVPFADKYIVGSRATCTHAPVVANNRMAELCQQFAGMASVFEALYDDVHPFLTPVQNRATIQAGKKTCRMTPQDAAAFEQKRWRAVACPATKDIDHTVIAKLINEVMGIAAAYVVDKKSSIAKGVFELVFSLLLTLNHLDRDAFAADIAIRIYRSMLNDTSEYGTGSDVRKIALKILATMADRDMRDQVAQALKDIKVLNTREQWKTFLEQTARLDDLRDGRTPSGYGQYGLMVVDGEIFYHPTSGEPPIGIGSDAAAMLAFTRLMDWADFSLGKVCGSPLYTAVPKPRRYPLANYIAERYPNLFDILFLDEAHEYNTDGSAQERAAHLLSGLGHPIVALTGTSNNGYASSLFANMWAFSRRFRSEFGRDELMGFVNRYGYRKVRVEPKDGGFIPKDYGAMSNRSDTGAGLLLRQIGQAPGVLPLFTLRHMLPVSVIIHKDDLDADLPPKREIPCAISPFLGTDIVKQSENLRGQLITTIMNDLRSGNGLAGKLWGQMAQLPTYLDRPHADTGNADNPLVPGGRRYEIRYPAAVGGHLVAAATPLPSDQLTPKETWILETVESEVAEGRPVMVLVENTRSGLATRLQRLVSDRIGPKVVYLDSSKVSAGKRQDWINTNVIKKRQMVLIVNPTAISTGLNNLVYFPTDIWYQNPRCSPIIYTQTNGRIHRPGQRSDEVRIYFPYYANTIQALHLNLLGHKIASVRQVDGLDISSALIAAGADGEADAAQAMSVGKALYEMMVNDLRVKDSYFGDRGHAAANGKGANGQSKKGETGVRQPIPLPPVAPLSGPPIQLKIFSL